MTERALEWAILVTITIIGLIFYVCLLRERIEAIGRGLMELTNALAEARRRQFEHKNPNNINDEPPTNDEPTKN